MTSEAEAPPAHTEQSETSELKTFPARSVKNRHISVTRGLTRQMPSGDFVKIVVTSEMDIQPAVAFAECFSQLNVDLKRILEEAFKQETSQHEAPKHARVEATTPVVSSQTSPIRSDNPYETIPGFKQSLKKTNLRTLRITPQLLENPLVRELYDKVREWRSMRVGKKNYTYSQLDNGMEFISEWSQCQIG